MTDGKKLLGVDEVCDLTGLGRSTIYGEVNSARLRSIKVGTRRLIPLSALDEWISEKAEEAGL